MQLVRLDVKNLQWRAEMNPKTGVWVAACDVLAQVVEADSWGDLCSTINEVTNELLRDLLEDGELDKFLLQKGWTMNTPLPHDVPPDGILFDVPADVVRAALRA